MNILVATSRAVHPAEEWALLGIRNLMEEAIASPIRWVTLDRELQRAQLKGDLGHQTNTFRHQTLLPFQLAIVAGGTQWQSPHLNTFYSLISQSKLPLLTLGLGMPAEVKTLNNTLVKCFKRRSTGVTVRDIETKNYFRQHGIESTMLPCPSLFASSHPPASVSVAMKPKVGFLINSEHYPSRPQQAEFVREVTRFISSNSENYQIEIFCPTVQDFMRFAPQFGSRVFFSYEAQDYLQAISKVDMVVTNDLTGAHLANSVGKLALYLSEAPINELEFVPRPFIVPSQLTDLEAKFQKVAGKKLISEGIASWKRKMKVQWFLSLPKESAPLREAI